MLFSVVFEFMGAEYYVSGAYEKGLPRTWEHPEEQDRLEITTVEVLEGDKDDALWNVDFVRGDFENKVKEAIAFYGGY